MLRRRRGSPTPANTTLVGRVEAEEDAAAAAAGAAANAPATASAMASGLGSAAMPSGKGSKPDAAGMTKPGPREPISVTELQRLVTATYTEQPRR